MVSIQQYNLSANLDSEGCFFLTLRSHRLGYVFKILSADDFLSWHYIFHFHVLDCSFRCEYSTTVNPPRPCNIVVVFVVLVQEYLVGVGCPPFALKSSLYFPYVDTISRTTAKSSSASCSSTHIRIILKCLTSTIRMKSCRGFTLSVLPPCRPSASPSGR